MQAVEKPNNNYHTIISDSFNNTNNENEIKLSPIVQKSLEKIIRKEDFIFYKISKRIISTNGSNFMGQLYEIDIEGEAMEDFVNIKNCYLNEILFYNELSEVFNTLQENANIPAEEKFKIIKSYGCNSNAIILENIARKGFRSLYRMDVMPIKFMELTISQLAKFHGLSFVLRHTNRDLFENMIETLHATLNYDNQELWKSYAEKQFAFSSQYFNSAVQKKIDMFLQNEFIPKFSNYSSGFADSVKCMCHGDFRMSNLLVKGNGEDDSEVVIVDYQILYYGSPIMDILHVIFTGTDGKFRKAHMNRLRDLYHVELTKFLQYFDLSADDVYPRKEFEKDFDNSLDYGLMIALYVTPFIFTSEDEVPDFAKDSLAEVNLKVDDRFKERITGIVEEFIERGILV